jgi:hypothetical protein
MKCPACGGTTTAICRCDKCGDVRCGTSLCKGTMGGPGTASPNNTCRACHKGKYVKIS